MKLMWEIEDECKTLRAENAALKVELKSCEADGRYKDMELAQMKAENQKLRLDYLSAETQAGEHFDEVQRLRAELKQEKDVARYHEAEAAKWANQLEVLKSQEPVAWLHPCGDVFRERKPNCKPLFTRPRDK